MYGVSPELKTVIIVRRLSNPCRWLDFCGTFRKHPSHLKEILWEGLHRFYQDQQDLQKGLLNFNFIVQRFLDIYNLHKRKSGLWAAITRPPRSYPLKWRRIQLSLQITVSATVLLWKTHFSITLWVQTTMSSSNSNFIKTGKMLSEDRKILSLCTIRRSILYSIYKLSTRILHPLFKTPSDVRDTMKNLTIRQKNYICIEYSERVRSDRAADCKRCSPKLDVTVHVRQSRPR